MHKVIFWDEALSSRYWQEEMTGLKDLRDAIREHVQALKDSISLTLSYLYICVQVSPWAPLCQWSEGPTSAIFFLD